MKMKKLFAVTAALCICLNMAACGKTAEEKPAETTAATTTTTVETTTTTEATTTEATETTTAAPETTTKATTTAESKADESSEDEKDADIVEVKLKDDEVDITLPYTLDVPLGTGRAEFVYPTGSLKMKVFEAPSYGAAVVTEVTAGTDITVYAKATYQGYNFCYIDANGTEGWCISTDIRETSAFQDIYDMIKNARLPENIYDEYKKMYVFSETLDIMSAPDDGSDVVYSLNQAQQMFVLGDNGSDRYFVSCSDNTGSEIVGWVTQNSGYWFDNFYEENEYKNKYYERYGEETSLGNIGNVDTGKPVIYLYPEEEMQVDVKLELHNAEFWTTYPKYEDGWSVTAKPDGKLTDKDGHTYDYLFWDGKDRNIYDMSEGFCVKGEDTVDFLREKLTLMGLNETEMNEFITYWLPKMEHNEYNLVAFQTAVYDHNFPLTVTPKPDSILRLLMTYKPLDEYIEIEPQQLDGFERKGFTVVEWGGEELGDNYIQ